MIKLYRVENGKKKNYKQVFFYIYILYIQVYAVRRCGREVNTEG